MGTSTPPPPVDQPAATGTYGPRPSGSDQFFDGIRRTGLVRSEDRWFGGVAGGLASRVGIDPIVMRGAFGLAAFLGGLGLVLYGIGWALLPEQRDGRIHLQQLLRGSFDVAVLGAFTVLVLGLSSPGDWLPWWGGWWHGEWWTGLLWVSAVLLVVALVVRAVKDGSGGPTTSLPVPGGPTTAPPPPHGPGRPGSATAPPPPPTGWTATAPTEGRTTDAARQSTRPTTPSAHGQYAGAGIGTAHAGASSGPYADGGYSGGGYGGYSAGGGYSGGYAAGPPPAASRSVRRGPGTGTVGVVVALSLLTLAGLMYAQRVGEFQGPVLLTAGSVAVVLTGLAVIVAGLRGRTSGALGGLAVVAVLLLVPATAVERTPWSWDGTTTVLGELTRTPQTVAEAEQGYSLAAGEARLDLTQVPLGRGTVQVPVSVGAGEVTVVVPEGGAYAADITVYAGEVRWLDDMVETGVLARPERYESPAVTDGAEPRLLLDVNVGAGEVRVVEAGR